MRLGSCNRLKTKPRLLGFAHTSAKLRKWTYLACFRACCGSWNYSRYSSCRHHHHHHLVAPPHNQNRFPRPLLPDPTDCRPGVRPRLTCSLNYHPPHRCCRRRQPWSVAASLRLCCRGRLSNLFLCLCPAIPRQSQWWRLQLSCCPGTNESSHDRRFLYPTLQSQCCKCRHFFHVPVPALSLFPVHASLCSCRRESHELVRVNLLASRLLVWAAFLFSPSLQERVFCVPLQSRCLVEPHTRESGLGQITDILTVPQNSHQAPGSISGWRAQTEWPVCRSGSPKDAIFLHSSHSFENTAGLYSASSTTQNLRILPEVKTILSK